MQLPNWVLDKIKDDLAEFEKWIPKLEGWTQVEVDPLNRVVRYERGSEMEPKLALRYNGPCNLITYGYSLGTTSFESTCHRSDLETVVCNLYKVVNLIQNLHLEDECPR